MRTDYWFSTPPGQKTPASPSENSSSRDYRLLLSQPHGLHTTVFQSPELHITVSRSEISCSLDNRILLFHSSGLQTTVSPNEISCPLDYKILISNPLDYRLLFPKEKIGVLWTTDYCLPTPNDYSS